MKKLDIKRKMNVMFDLHGVIEKCPELFKPFMKTLRAAGHSVYICSGAKMERILKEIEELGYIDAHHYDKVVSVIDFLRDNKKVEFEFDQFGEPWCDDEIWWKSKGWIADYYEIDIVIDDSEQYRSNIDKSKMFLLMR